MSCAVSLFGSKWRETAGVKPIDCGGVYAGLPNAEFVVPRVRACRPLRMRVSLPKLLDPTSSLWASVLSSYSGRS